MDSTWNDIVSTGARTATTLLIAALLIGGLCGARSAYAATIYVRTTGNDNDNGSTPADALQSITHAASVAHPLDRIVVGPGTYHEGEISPQHGGVSFIADREGTETGDPPGDVVLDATGAQSGFDVRNKAVVIDGFAIQGGAFGIVLKGQGATTSPVVSNNVVFDSISDGILIQDMGNAFVSNNLVYNNGGSGINLIGTVSGLSTAELAGNRIAGNGDRGVRVKGIGAVTVHDCIITENNNEGVFVDTGDKFVVRNCVVSSNHDHGIEIERSSSTRIVNNLVYANIAAGLYFIGAPNASVLNNTWFANGSRGVWLAGSDSIEASPGAVVLRNIFQGNAIEGLKVNTLSLPRYTGDYNLVADPYGSQTPIGAHDIIVADAGLVAPAGADGILGGAGGADDDFHLDQPAAGQGTLSPAVDAGGITAIQAGVNTLTTRTDGVPDMGPVDLGYHYPVPEQPTVTVLYVSPDGADNNTGFSAVRALQTIAEALRRATTGMEVQLLPGTYKEASLRPAAGVSIVGSDNSLAVVDANNGSTAFDVRANGVSITNVGITGATSAGVRVLADTFQMVGCQVFSNSGKGVLLAFGNNGLIFNNLVYQNGNSGIVIGISSTGANAATVVQNTIIDNAGSGVTVGLSAQQASVDAAIVNNIMAGNAGFGFEVGSGTATNMVASHNCNSDGYKGVAPSRTDVTADPALVAPSGVDDMFFLAQEDAGQTVTSPCVDAGLGVPSELGLQTTTTRTDGEPDVGRVDIGYHHELPALNGIDIGAAVRNPLQGDCNGDGRVTVDELLLGVNIALGSAPLTDCPSFDLDHSGQVTVDELISALQNALGG